MGLTALRVKRSFTAWGRDYAAGDLLDPTKDIKNWPKEVRAETLKTRLENGDLEYDLPVEEIILAEGESEETAGDEPPKTDGPATTGGRAFTLP